jgi:hypothetical protein
MSNRIEIDSGTGELLAEIRNRVGILTLNDGVCSTPELVRRLIQLRCLPMNGSR